NSGCKFVSCVHCDRQVWNEEHVCTRQCCHSGRDRVESVLHQCSAKSVGLGVGCIRANAASHVRAHSCPGSQLAPDVCGERKRCERYLVQNYPRVTCGVHHYGGQGVH